MIFSTKKKANLMIKMITKTDICECSYNFDTFIDQYDSEIHIQGKNLVVRNFEPLTKGLGNAID